VDAVDGEVVTESVGRLVIFVAALAVVSCGTFYEARTGPHWVYCDQIGCPNEEHLEEHVTESTFDYRTHQCACWFAHETDCGTAYRFILVPAGRAKPPSPALYVEAF
jgi:hypothetical protein